MEVIINCYNNDFGELFCILYANKISNSEKENINQINKKMTKFETFSPSTLRCKLQHYHLHTNERCDITNTNNYYLYIYAKHKNNIEVLIPVCIEIKFNNISNIIKIPVTIYFDYKHQSPVINLFVNSIADETDVTNEIKITQLDC